MYTVENYSEFVRSRVKWLNDWRLDLIHASVGLVGEVNELRNANTRLDQIEELGDFGFYLEHAKIVVYDHGGRRDEETVNAYMRRAPTRPLTALLALDNCAHELLDMAKKIWVYGKPVSTHDLVATVDKVEEEYLYTFRAFGFGLTAVRQANLEKLLKRYPGGYTDKDAQARADKVLAQSSDFLKGTGK